jgi:hypothetical protein
MRRYFFWIASWLVIGLSACTTLRPPHPDTAKVDTAKACAEWRWIGISRAEAKCPDVPGWTVRPLFPQLAPVQQKSENSCKEEVGEKVPGSDLIRELNRFCVYEADQHGSRPASHPPAPPVSAELVRIDQDCAALSLSGTSVPVAPKDWSSHSARLLEQTGQETFAVANPRGVRLAFLDTQPTYEGFPEEQGNSPHGYTLAQIARHLVCNGESCAAQITTRLALPILHFNPKSRSLTRIDLKRGGYIGMQGELADAIVEEVRAWERGRRNGSKQNLILNLSLAWDGELFGGLHDSEIAEMRAGTQAVYRALQYATGFDVLVLAAAGNQKAAPCMNSGPLLPAAWEQEAPWEKSCGKLPKAPHPLLYAVGGVQGQGHPLINARPGGMPRRAAYAERAVVACFGRDQPTAILTGSSVATAVASSIAAVVWSFHPKYKSWQVMDILDQSGDELKLDADFWFGSSTFLPARPKVHKLSLCAALEKACKGPEPCPFKCPVRMQEPSSSQSASAPDGWPDNWVRDSCQPWLTPQPDQPPCLPCGPPDTQ